MFTIAWEVPKRDCLTSALCVSALRSCLTLSSVTTCVFKVEILMSLLNSSGSRTWVCSVGSMFKVSSVSVLIEVWKKDRCNEILWSMFVEFCWHNAEFKRLVYCGPCQPVFICHQFLKYFMLKYLLVLTTTTPTK